MPSKTAFDCSRILKQVERFDRFWFKLCSRILMQVDRFDRFLFKLCSRILLYWIGSIVSGSRFVQGSCCKWIGSIVSGSSFLIRSFNIRSHFTILNPLLVFLIIWRFTPRHSTILSNDVQIKKLERKKKFFPQNLCNRN